MPLLPRRALFALPLVLGLAACSTGGPALDEPIEPIGDLKIGHIVVVTKNAQKGPLSRDGDLEGMKTSLETALAARLNRYDQGDKFYHVAVHLDAYVLAVPGVPLVASPKSAFIVSVTVWDDDLGKPINEPTQLTVLESLSAENVIGSGLTQSAETQRENLNLNAAAAVERFLKVNADWFSPDRPEGLLKGKKTTPGPEATES